MGLIATRINHGRGCSKLGQWAASHVDRTTSHPLVGLIRLDKELLRKMNLSMDSLLLNLKRSIKTNGNPLNDLSDRLILHISENC